jgi:hypothetical protein
MFFALDELHLIGHGICKHLYRLYIGKYDVKGATTKYSLGSGAWNAVANDLLSNSIDYEAFENGFRLPAKQRSHRAVDWIGLLSYDHDLQQISWLQVYRETQCGFSCQVSW